MLYVVRGFRVREEKSLYPPVTRVQNRTLVKGFTKVHGCLVLNLVSNLGQEGPHRGESEAPPGVAGIS